MALERKLQFGNAIWIDLVASNPEDLEAIAKEFNLAPSMVLDCLDPGHLPLIQKRAELSFLILRAFDDKSPADATTAQEATRKIAIFWGENFLLTVHRAPFHWLDAVWNQWEKRTNREASQLAPVLYELVEESLYSFEDPIDKSAVTVDELEDLVFQESSTRVTPRAVLESAYLAKKRATLFKRMLRLTRDVLPSISKLGDANSVAIQNLKEEAERLHFYADDLVESSNDLIQLSISMSSNRMNEVVRVLTIVSIFLLPLNLVVGVYGMNFAYMPELSKPWGYPAVLGLMVVIELGIYFLLRKKGWIRARRR